MSSDMSVKVFLPLLLAAITVVGGGLTSPAAAQRVEVFVNGQRVTDVVINGRVSNGANGHVNGGAGYVDRGNYVNGANGYVDGVDTYADAADGDGYVNGANGTQYGFVNGANGGNRLRRGVHSHSHVGPNDDRYRGNASPPVF